MTRAVLWLLTVLASAALSALLFFWLRGERGRLRRSTREFLRQSGFGVNALHGYVHLRWILPYIKTLLRLPDPRTSQPAAKGGGLAGPALSRQSAHAWACPGHRRAELRDSTTEPRPDRALRGGPEYCPARAARRGGVRVRVPPRARHPLQSHTGVHGGRQALHRFHPGASPGRIPPAHAIRGVGSAASRASARACALSMVQRRPAEPLLCHLQLLQVLLRRHREDAARRADDGQLRLRGRDRRHALRQLRCCVEACPFGALANNDGEITRDWELCMGCGVCEVSCAASAISLARDERKGVPLDVRTLHGDG